MHYVIIAVLYQWQSIKMYAFWIKLWQIFQNMKDVRRMQMARHTVTKTAINTAATLKCAVVGSFSNFCMYYLMQLIQHEF